MSWIDKIQSDFTITCGDGTSYTPLWINASKAIEYNVAAFEFPGLAGTLVKRKLPKGRRYNLEIYFQGEDHLDTAEAFERSSADSNPWTLSHPFYGSLLVQPTSMVFDNSGYNVTKISIHVIETIRDDAPKATVSATDKIIQEKEDLDQIQSLSYSVDVPAPKAPDVQGMKQNVEQFYNIGIKKVTNTLDAEDLRNAFSKANSFINNQISEPFLVLRQMQALLNLPSAFADSIKNRLNLFVSQLVSLGNAVNSLVSGSSKKLYQHNAGTIIGAMAVATVTNATYNSRNDVLAVIDQLLAAHSGYLTNLDSLQSSNGGQVDAFIPDAASMEGLSRLISLTVANLLQIASNSKQERTFYLEDDTNLVELAHRLYGLLPDDSTIERVINENGIGLKEMLSIRKGRKIVYYV